MQSRQLTNPIPSPPTNNHMSRPSTATSGNGRYKPPREQKVYYIPPPPPSTFQRNAYHHQRPVAPIYSHNNSSYHSSHTDVSRTLTMGDSGNVNANKKTPFPFRTRTDSNASSATLTSSRSSSPSPGSSESKKPADNDILPPPPPGVPTSRYIHMLLSIDSIPKIYNLIAAFSTWILLAGYVLLPGTFTSLQNLPSSSDSSSSEKDSEDPPNAIQTWILDRVRNTPLLYIAAVCSALGILGMSLLWFRWRRNYVWIINRIFLPGTLNSLAGIISTIVNVHTAQQGKYSLTAIVSITVTAVSTVVNGTLWLVYSNWALKRVQEMHAREYFGRKGDEEVGKMELGESGELVEVHDGDESKEERK